MRVQPAGPPEAYQTYKIVSPRDTTIVAACADAGCEAWRDGWDTAIDESTDLGKTQAHYIRTRSGRTFREMRSGELTVFRFESGQRCFRDHHTRSETYGVHAGDWRLAGGLIRHHTRPRDWVEDMGENLDRIRTAQQRG